MWSQAIDLGFRRTVSIRSITRQKTVQHVKTSSVWQVGVKPSGGKRQEQSSKLHTSTTSDEWSPCTRNQRSLRGWPNHSPGRTSPEPKISRPDRWSHQVEVESELQVPRLAASCWRSTTGNHSCWRTRTSRKIDSRVDAQIFDTPERGTSREWQDWQPVRATYSFNTATSLACFLWTYLSVYRVRSQRPSDRSREDWTTSLVWCTSALRPRGKDHLDTAGKWCHVRLQSFSAGGQRFSRVVTLTLLVLTLSVHSCELRMCKHVKPV